MTTSFATILTSVIGEELARLIRDGMASRLKVAQYGGLERVASAPEWETLLPALFVVPGETIYSEEGKLDIGNLQPEVTESYRIVYFFKYGEQDNIPVRAAEDMRLITATLTADAGLSNLWQYTKPNQISYSSVLGVEWSPEEQSYFSDAAQRVKVTALRWQVRWYSRAR